MSIISSEDKKGIIYGLYDPRTNQLRYVGKTARPLEIRIRHHIKPEVLSRHDTHLTRWLRQLRDAELKPIEGILDEVLVSQLDQAEIFWIDHMRSLGCDLVNTAEGGTGGATRKGQKNTPEHNKRLHEGLAQARANGTLPSWEWSEESKTNQSKRRKGMKFTEAHKTNIVASRKGKKLSTTHKENIGKGNEGREVSDKTRQAISKSKKGTYTEAMRQQVEHLRVINKGRHHTTEHNEKTRQKIGKLDWKKVDKIRALLSEEQFSNSQIGKLYGVSARTILSIKKEETWKIQFHP